MKIMVVIFPLRLASSLSASARSKGHLSTGLPVLHRVLYNMGGGGEDGREAEVKGGRE